MELLARLMLAIILISMGTGLLTGCGPYEPGIDYEITEYDGDLKNGDIRDEYVYYDGTWYYHGIGAPYIWED